MRRILVSASLVATLGLAALTLRTLLAPGTALAQSPGDLSASLSASQESSEVTTALDSLASTASPEVGTANSAELDPAAFLIHLREREQALDARERAIENERAALETLRGEIEARIAELQTLREDIDERLAIVDRARQRRIQELATWYAAMEPQQAATQLGTQEITTIVEVLQQMDQRSASAVLESLDVAVAAHVVEEMSRRR